MPYEILTRDPLGPQVVRNEIHAPLVARRCQPGQFVILRVHERGERIPLTIAAYDRARGTITLIYQVVGKTTALLADKQAGESLHDVAGPLGAPSDLEGLRKVAVIGGGLGCAIAYPQAGELHRRGAYVDCIAGFRSRELVLLEPELRAVSDRLFVMTDDGSYGEKGLVTAKLEQLLQADADYDAVIAIGPLVMMKFVSLLTKRYGVRTIVSMNPVMIDGTGMCGGCRIRVDGQTRFACVDGPDFDGHLVDFDDAIRRAGMYRAQEQEAMERHRCRLEGMDLG